MAWWSCKSCAVYWSEAETESGSEYSVCWCCGEATGVATARLHVRYDTQHVMTFPETQPA